MKLRRKLLNRRAAEDRKKDRQQQQQPSLEISMRDLVITADALSFGSSAPNRNYLPGNMSPKPLNHDDVLSPNHDRFPSNLPPSGAGELPDILSAQQRTPPRTRLNPGLHRIPRAPDRPRDLFQRPISYEDESRDHIPRDYGDQSNESFRLFDMGMDNAESSPSSVRKQRVARKPSVKNKRELQKVSHFKEIDFSLDGRQLRDHSL